MATPSSTAVMGSTGLVGSHILSTLLSDLSASAPSPVHTISRRAPKAPSNSAPSRLNAVIEAKAESWPSAFGKLSPAPRTVFSAVGTTRAAAGSLAAQWKIDHDVNIALARAAHQAGTRTFVFISAQGTRNMLSARSPYCQMKNGVEDAVRDMGFEHAIMIKPGIILGPREQSRTVEGLAQTTVRALGCVSGWAKDSVGQDAEVIARAAVRAAQLAEQGKAPSKFWLVEPKDIVKLGRDEWPGDASC
ncbi:hypothetical protein CDD81_453 [Ophiocordyceps australis]|uniref:NAD-dependent epimerase/dehydratase domain-containing protein n=1 Tax=Ophiocordyceps australis TaxID=1399860 RepID=A0A2C5XVS0_9HYPO|nr:hypothetical protein CDD81_453 [Ophiocordyceps australis]